MLIYYRCLHAPSASDMTDEEKHSACYSKDESKAFEVHFNPNIDLLSLLEVPTASDTIDEEKHSACYSKNELKAFKNNVMEDSRLKRPKQKVRFRPYAELLSLLKVPTASDLTDEERCLAWYSNDELKAFKNSAMEDNRLKGRKQKVSFSPFAELLSLLEVPTASDMTYEERCLTWYSKDELKVSRNNQKNLLKSNAYKAQYISCVHGRECYINPGHQENKDMPLATATTDVIAAHPKMKPLASKVIHPVPISDIPWSKRKFSFPTHELLEKERRVKRKMSAQTGVHVNNAIN